MSAARARPQVPASQIPKTLAPLAVPIDSVKPFPGNARRGDVERIVESLERNGQFRPIIANTRTKHVLGGNHVREAALTLGWKFIAVTWVDVPKAKEARIVLADNRLGDLGTYDPDALLDLVRSQGTDVLGIGWTPDELVDLLDPGDPVEAAPRKAKPTAGAVTVLYCCPECGHEWKAGDDAADDE